MKVRINPDDCMFIQNPTGKPYLYGTVVKGLWFYSDRYKTNPNVLHDMYVDIEAIILQMRTKQDLLNIRDNQTISMEEEF